MIRASSFAGSGVISSSGGGGGQMVVMAESGGLDAASLRSTGSGGFNGGRVLTTGVPNAVDVTATDPPGADGVVSTDHSIRELIGVELGVGCEPGIQVIKETTTPSVANSDSAVVGYRITVENRKGRGTAVSVAIVDPLPTFEVQTSFRRAGPGQGRAPGRPDRPQGG